jgi:UDP-glucose 4-epimerase
LNLIAFLRSTADHQISVLDDFSLGNKAHLREFDLDIFEGDIQDEGLALQATKGADAVIHLGADTRVMESIGNPSHNFNTNVCGTFNLLRCARTQNVKHFIFASTGGAILGNAVAPVHENMLPRPISPYGASKLSGEAYCSAFTGAYGLKTVCLRFSNVYGPRSYHKGSVVAHFLKSIIAEKELTVYGDGTQTRDYVYVDDICDGIVKALRADKSGVYQLGTGVPTTINDLIQLIQNTVGEVYPIKVRYEGFREGEVRNTWCDIRKARGELGYASKTVLKDGIKRTYEWFCDHLKLLRT